MIMIILISFFIKFIATVPVNLNIPASALANQNPGYGSGLEIHNANPRVTLENIAQRLGFHRNSHNWDGMSLSGEDSIYLAHNRHDRARQRNSDNQIDNEDDSIVDSVPDFIDFTNNGDNQIDNEEISIWSPPNSVDLARKRLARARQRNIDNQNDNTHSLHSFGSMPFGEYQALTANPRIIVRPDWRQLLHDEALNMDWDSMVQALLAKNPQED